VRAESPEVTLEWVGAPSPTSVQRPRMRRGLQDGAQGSRGRAGVPQHHTVTPLHLGTHKHKWGFSRFSNQYPSPRKTLKKPQKAIKGSPATLASPEPGLYDTVAIYRSLCLANTRCDAHPEHPRLRPLGYSVDGAAILDKTDVKQKQNLKWGEKLCQRRHGAGVTQRARGCRTWICASPPLPASILTGRSGWRRAPAAPPSPSPSHLWAAQLQFPPFPLGSPPASSSLRARPPVPVGPNVPNISSPVSRKG